MEKTTILIKDGLEPGVPNQDLASLSFQHRAVLPAWLQHPPEPQPAGSCGSPVQRHKAAVLHGWCEQGSPLPAKQTASGWPRAAPRQPVVCCTSPVHSQVLTALPQPPANPGQLLITHHTDCALAKASWGWHQLGGGKVGAGAGDPAQVSALLDTSLGAASSASQAGAVWRMWIQLPLLGCVSKGGLSMGRGGFLSLLIL